MKGKRYTTEDKLRILREADRGKRILEVCRAHNISEVSFHRWKRPFGQMDLSEARKLKELERENGELKKMQSRSVAQEPRAGGCRRKKMGSPAHRRAEAHVMVRHGLCSGRLACRFLRDATVRGGALKMLTILDEHTRVCHVLRPDRAMRAADVLAWLERAIKAHGAPAYLRSDNGP